MKWHFNALFKEKHPELCNLFQNRFQRKTSASPYFIWITSTNCSRETASSLERWKGGWGRKQKLLKNTFLNYIDELQPHQCNVKCMFSLAAGPYIVQCMDVNLKQISQGLPDGMSKAWAPINLLTEETYARWTSAFFLFIYFVIYFVIYLFIRLTGLRSLRFAYPDALSFSPHWNTHRTRSLRNQAVKYMRLFISKAKVSSARATVNTSTSSQACGVINGIRP